MPISLTTGVRKERKQLLSWEMRAIKYFVVSATSVLFTSIWGSVNKFYKTQKLQMCTCKVSFHLCQLTPSQKQANLLSSEGSNIVFIHFIDISKRKRIVCVFRAAHDLRLTTASASFFIVFCCSCLHGNMTKKLCQIIHMSVISGVWNGI